MKEKELSDFENQLKEQDSGTLSQRAARLQRLDSLKIVIVPTFRAFDYVHEARLSYINGCYRSCILCSWNVVEQSFLHKLISTSEDWEEMYWEIRKGKKRFKDIGEMIKKNSKKHIELKAVCSFLNDADWLRTVRNEIVAHPGYIPDYLELKDEYRLVVANRIMFRDISALLRFFDSQKRERLVKEKLTIRTPDGRVIGDKGSIGEFLKNPVKIDVAKYFDWWAFQNGVLSYLALEAFERMTKIVNGIYFPQGCLKQSMSS